MGMHGRFNLLDCIPFWENGKQFTNARIEIPSVEKFIRLPTMINVFLQNVALVLCKLGSALPKENDDLL